MVCRLRCDNRLSLGFSCPPLASFIRGIFFEVTILNKFGDTPRHMVGNIIDAEKKSTSGGGYVAMAFVCPSCGHSRSSVEHRTTKGKCAKQLQKEYYNKGGK